MTERIERSALYEQVAERLRKRIYNHDLLPGQAIDEKQLCEQFGISRTPLREALKVLHSESLVELIPRRGCFVKALELDEMRELFPVMAVLEGLCAREAVSHCTEEDLARLEQLHAQLEDYAAEGNIDAYYEVNFLIHQLIQEMSQNRWLQRVTTDLRKILRLARHTQLTIDGRLQQSLQEHRKIMETFRQQDADAAEQTMKMHLTAQLETLEQWASSGSRSKLANSG
jgi:DNA-binding GntR family transcriptional regulator